MSTQDKPKPTAKSKAKTTAKSPSDAPAGAARDVSVNLLTVWPGNARRHDADGLDALAASVKASGILQPLLARPQDDGYEIVCGARRLAAARAAGLATVPIYIRELTDKKAAAAVAAENLQREDFAPLDAAAAVQAALAAYGDAQAAADALGRPVGWVRRAASLTNLTGPWHKCAEEYGLDFGFLAILARLPHDAQDAVAAEFPESALEDGGDAACLARVTARLTASITECAWLAKDKGCKACLARTDADGLLFPDYDEKRPHCLNRACREAKRQSYIDAQKAKAAAEARIKPSEVKPAEWARAQDTCHRDAEHTVPVVITEGPASGSIHWQKPEPEGQPDATPKGPTPAQRMAARFIRDVEARLDKGAIEEWAKDKTFPDLIGAVLLFGCQGVHPPPDEIVMTFNKVAGFDEHAELRADVADRIEPGIRERLKFAKVGECADAYAWACAVCEILGIEIQQPLKGSDL